MDKMPFREAQTVTNLQPRDRNDHDLRLEAGASGADRVDGDTP
jgi:hypothetical protein